MSGRIDLIKYYFEPVTGFMVIDAWLSGQEGAVLDALHHLVLPHGAWNLANNVPGHDLNLLATTTTVVVTQSLHPALVSLLMKAMQKTHAKRLAGIVKRGKNFCLVNTCDSDRLVHCLYLLPCAH